MARRLLLAALLILGLAAPALAQQKKAANSDPVVARINGQVLHRSDVELALHNAPPEIQKEPIEKIYPQLLGTMANGILLAQAARKARIDEEPIVKAQIAMATNEIIDDAYVAQLAHSQITEAKLHELYQQYSKNMSTQEEVRVRRIVVPTEKEAKDIIEQLKKGADFTALAKEKTIDPAGKTNGGDLGYFTKGEMAGEPAFADAAFVLKKGEFSQSPVRTRDGWDVIKVEDRRQAKAAPFNQVAPQIAQQMTQAIVAKRLQELHSQAKVQFYDLNGKPLAMAAPPHPAGAAPARAPAQAPVLALPGSPGGAGAPLAPPTLSPATAPDQLH